MSSSRLPSIRATARLALCIERVAYVSGLLTSCATLAASVPRKTTRSFRIACAWRYSRSVMSVDRAIAPSIAPVSARIGAIHVSNVISPTTDR